MLATLRSVLEIESVAAEADDLGPALDEAGRPRRPMVVVDADSDPAQLDRAIANLRGTGSIVVAMTRTSRPLHPLVEIADVSLARAPMAPDDGVTVAVPDPPAAVAQLQAQVEANPRAALALAWMLREGAELSVDHGLAAESTTYSMLLAGAEFRRWLDHRGPARPIDGGERVSVSRSGDTLSIVLNRPARRNAVDARMRDALREALSLAEWEDSLAVEVSGAGPSFSSGGDLDEFGTADDPPTAHLVRVTASVGAALHRLRARTTVRVHGVCMGAGVELPAFAGRVVAAPGTTFALPEIGMGLIPGAGGTVSIPRRIGAPRALWLALAGVPLDAPTALAWGLVDAIG